MTSHKLASGFTLAAVIAATLSGAAFAERSPRGPLEFLDFGAMDANKDGKITRAEIEAQHAARLLKADTNGDAKFSVDELFEMRLEAVRAQLRDKTGRMIKAHDTDGDGFLSATEMPAPRFEGKFFGKVDTDGDGALSLAEVEVARAKMQAHRGGQGFGQGFGHGFGQGFGQGFGKGDDDNG